MEEDEPKAKAGKAKAAEPAGGLDVAKIEKEAKADSVRGALVVEPQPGGLGFRVAVCT